MQKEFEVILGLAEPIPIKKKRKEKRILKKNFGIRHWIGRANPMTKIFILIFWPFVKFCKKIKEKRKNKKKQNCVLFGGVLGFCGCFSGTDFRDPEISARSLFRKDFVRIPM